MLSIMRVTDVYDANVIGRVACMGEKAGSVIGGAYPYSTRWLTSCSLAMIPASFGRSHMPLRISVDRGKE
jgi:hypothetical protein